MRGRGFCLLGCVDSVIESPGPIDAIPFQVVRQGVQSGCSRHAVPAPIPLPPIGGASLQRGR